MGPAVAPPFSNLYLFWKLRRFFYRHHKFIVFQRRYINDGLALFRGEEMAERIRNEIEDVYNLKSTFSWNWNLAVYLDIEIYKGPRFKAYGILDT